MSHLQAPAPAHPSFGEDVVASHVPVLDSHIYTLEHGDGDPIVFIHGNPTSSYLWRHIVRRLKGQGRLLALDLIGYGQSGKPQITYTLEHQQRYLDAWFAALDLQRVTLVVQDYGAAFGLHWASRHSGRVKAVCLLEPVLRNLDSHALPASFVQVRAQLRQAGIGEQYVLHDNRFMTELFPQFFLVPLAAQDLAQYQQPFPTPESRQPVLAGPRHLPVDGEPPSSLAFLAPGQRWLAHSAIPKLLLTFEPGFLLTPEVLAWCREHIPHLEVQAAGAGLHYVQEEAPEAIAYHLQQWLARQGLHKRPAR